MKRQTRSFGIERVCLFFSTFQLNPFQLLLTFALKSRHMKALGLFFVLSILIFACNPSSNQREGAPERDLETERLQREVDSLKRIKAELQEQLQENRSEATPPMEPSEEPILNEPDDPASGPIGVISAKKVISSDFKPILQLDLQNNSDKTVRSVELGVDFSYNSNKISENCHFEKTINVSIAPGASKRYTLPIPGEYDKTCADKAWVVVKNVGY
jgi:hypothetical protein